MKKQIVFYQFMRYSGKPLSARREISFEIKLASRLILDELCFKWNKNQLENDINRSIDENNKEEFVLLSELYRFNFRE